MTACVWSSANAGETRQLYASYLKCGFAGPEALTTDRADSDQSDEEVNIDAARVPCGPKSPNRTLWRYNGKQYVGDASVQ